MNKRYFIATFSVMSMLGEMGRRKVIEAVDIEDAKTQFLIWYMKQNDLMQQDSLRLDFREEEGLYAYTENSIR
jgi:hypothetical protein